MLAEIRVADCIIRREPPDTIYVTTVGNLDEREMTAILDAVVAFAKDMPTVFLLDDVSAMGTISAGARRVAGQRASSMPWRGVAVFGARFSHRVVATMVASVLKAFNKGLDFPLSFFETEAEARAWIASQRGTAPGA